MACRMGRVAGRSFHPLKRRAAVAGPCQSIGYQNLSTTSCASHAALSSVKSDNPANGLHLPVDHVYATQPPSARPFDTRKSQLIRTYTSLLRTMPLILFFQHSNLTAVEWSAVRRELKKAIDAVALVDSGAENVDIGRNVQLDVVRTNMLRVALKIVEFHSSEAEMVQTSALVRSRKPLVHDLSQAAYDTIRNIEVPPESAFAQLEPLLVGPVAVLTLPTVSPVHLAAALSVLAPIPGKFAAPTRKKNPGYHEPTCQSGLSKLMLIGGRIESRVFDQDAVHWVGGIHGGLEGLRAQLVHILQGASLGVANALGGGSQSLWVTLEGRKGQLEENEKATAQR